MFSVKMVLKFEPFNVAPFLWMSCLMANFFQMTIDPAMLEASVRNHLNQVHIL